MIGSESPWVGLLEHIVAFTPEAEPKTSTVVKRGPIPF
jgi:hypothetical protein